MISGWLIGFLDGEGDIVGWAFDLVEPGWLIGWMAIHLILDQTLDVATQNR